MAFRQCGICDIDYPYQVHVCHVCGAVTVHRQEGEYDRNWQAKVNAKKHERQQDAQGMFTGPKAAPDLPQLPPVHHSNLTLFGGETWVHETILSDAGYDIVGVDSVIRVAGRTGDIFFEVAGRAGRTKEGVERPGWWLNRIPSPEEMFADLPVLGGEET